MRQDSPRKRIGALTDALLLTSMAVFTLGLMILVRAYVEAPSVIAFFVLFVSMPGWIVGAVCAAVAVARIVREEPLDHTMVRMARSLFVMNLAALFITFIAPPRGVS